MNYVDYSQQIRWAMFNKLYGLRSLVHGLLSMNHGLV